MCRLHRILGGGIPVAWQDATRSSPSDTVSVCCQEVITGGALKTVFMMYIKTNWIQIAYQKRPAYNALPPHQFHKRIPRHPPDQYH